MSVAIQGSFEAYIWAALWQVALAGLQSGGPLFNPSAADDGWVARLQFAASLMASAVSWAAWGLSVWVGMRDGLSAGVVFGIFSFAVNVLTLIELHRLKPPALTVQLVGFFTMPLFACQTLNALGVLA
jgi:hypothetical protein